MRHNQFQLIGLEGIDSNSIDFLQSSSDKCEITLQWIQRLIVESEKNRTLDIAPPILSRVYNELGNGIVNLNNARKIKEFPIPFPLAQMIMVMLIFHALMTPLICAATVRTTTWAALITFVVIFSYWSILYIATELEMPFGDDLNDLPLQDMAKDMNVSLKALLHPCSQMVPKFTYVEDGYFDPSRRLSIGEVNFDHDLEKAVHWAIGQEARVVLAPEKLESKAVNDYSEQASKNNERASSKDVTDYSERPLDGAANTSQPSKLSPRQYSKGTHEEKISSEGMISLDKYPSDPPYHLSTPRPCKRDPAKSAAQGDSSKDAPDEYESARVSAASMRSVWTQHGIQTPEEPIVYRLGHSPGNSGKSSPRRQNEQTQARCVGDHASAVVLETVAVHLAE